ncbi:MAG: tetrahydromethanopterin S-methyltransferase subunit H [Candidatus Thorarchaeota archaeon]
MEQKILSISGVRIGGLPGRNATVVIPSIFYSKDPLVKDAEAGEINKKATEDILGMLSDMSDKTGLPTILDVVASSPNAMQSYLQYLVDACTFPLMIDGSGDNTVNSAGVLRASESGFLDRVILNSLAPETKSDIYGVIKETRLQNALLLTFTTQALASITKRVEHADNLIKSAQEAGIANIMLDTGVMDLLTLGIACKAQMILKDKYGFPVGNGAHNAISTWRGLVPKFGREAKKAAFASSSLIPVILGADFVLMGPAKNAPMVYPAVAMADTVLSGSLLEDRIRPEKPHPRYMIS